jgi:hypothetical protein
MIGDMGITLYCFLSYAEPSHKVCSEALNMS